MAGRVEVLSAPVEKALKWAFFRAGIPPASGLVRAMNGPCINGFGRNQRLQTLLLLLLIAGCAALSVSAAPVAASASTASTASAAGDSVAVASVRMIGMLALIIAGVLGAGRWLRHSRMLGSWKTPQARLQIVETRSLGQRQALCLVACDQREWLVAVGPTGIQMLSPLQPVPARPGSFQEHLDGVAEFPAPRPVAAAVEGSLHS